MIDAERSLPELGSAVPAVAFRNASTQGRKEHDGQSLS